ncbi:unnamed protein product [Acanthosepion pharaonis]|uniref:Uncharacterized protein n=1 Tax=Acanthosepion pharaonis TaxID=158019 RepID=A0A812DXE3_ACAPH|nr:unnamed protein product [Sepia pharaonis]
MFFSIPSLHAFSLLSFFLLSLSHSLSASLPPPYLLLFFLPFLTVKSYHRRLINHKKHIINQFSSIHFLSLHYLPFSSQFLSSSFSSLPSLFYTLFTPLLLSFSYYLFSSRSSFFCLSTSLSTSLIISLLPLFVFVPFYFPSCFPSCIILLYSLYLLTLHPLLFSIFPPLFLPLYFPFPLSVSSYLLLSLLPFLSSPSCCHTFCLPTAITFLLSLSFLFISLPLFLLSLLPLFLPPLFISPSHLLCFCLPPSITFCLSLSFLSPSYLCFSSPLSTFLCLPPSLLCLFCFSFLLSSSILPPLFLPSFYPYLLLSFTSPIIISKKNACF